MRRTWVLVGMCALAIGVLGVAGWLGWSLVTTVSVAHELQDHIDRTRADLNRLDTAATTADLRSAQASAAELQERMMGPAWSIAESMPVVGQSARAARAFASAADELASASLPLMEAIDAQSTTSGRLMAALEAPQTLDALRAAVVDAEAQLAPYSPDGLHFGLDTALTSAQESLTSMAPALDSAIEAAQPLRGMLGADGPRTWLVMSQNPAEIRPTGGLFNAYLLVRVTDGNVEILEAGSRKTLDDEFPNGEQIPSEQAVDAVTAATWGPALREWATFNSIADFPAVARLAEAGMKKRGTPIDGVIAIDPTVVAAILAGTGPVEHKGVTIDSSHAVDFFTKGLYTAYPGFTDVAAKDELAMGLTYATIDSALKRPLDASALLSALGPALADGHVKAWSSVPEEEAWLMTTPTADALAQEPTAVSVGFTNWTGGKLDPYVDRTVAVDASQCATNGQVTVTVDLSNHAPTGLPRYVDVTLGRDHLPDRSIPSGFTKTYVTIYAPITDNGAGWSSLDSLTLDGKDAGAASGGTEGFATWYLPVEVMRGERRTLEAVVSVPACPDGKVPAHPTTSG